MSRGEELRENILLGQRQSMEGHSGILVDYAVDERGGEENDLLMVGIIYYVELGTYSHVRCCES
jgi:hypothetical protein